jgi:MoaA/NifB/PqqE/SkfB family radical SAM enzyme
MKSNLVQGWTDAASFCENMTPDADKQTRIISGPVQITFNITDHCMMKCKHCFNRNLSVRRDEMSDWRVLKTFEEVTAMKPQHFCICGGEPLVRRNVAFKGAQLLIEAGTTVGMVSNGYLLNEGIANECSAIGLNQIQIGLDGFRASHDKLRGLQGAFKRAVKAIELLAAKGIRVTTSFSPTQFNISEFEKYVEFVNSLGVSEVEVQPLILRGESFFNSDLLPSDGQYFKMVRFIRSYQHKLMSSSEDQNCHINWGDPVDHIMRFSKYLIKPTYSFGITATGKIIVSPYVPIVFGDINRHCLNHYWEAGLKKIWDMDYLKDRVKHIYGIQSLGTAMPPVYYKKFAETDLIDDSFAQIKKKLNAHFK